MYIINKRISKIKFENVDDAVKSFAELRYISIKQVFRNKFNNREWIIDRHIKCSNNQIFYIKVENIK